MDNMNGSKIFGLAALPMLDPTGNGIVCIGVFFFISTPCDLCSNLRGISILSIPPRTLGIKRVINENIMNDIEEHCN